MFVLFISLFSLLIGLVLAPKLIQFPLYLSFFDGFVCIFIGGLVLFHIFPHSYTDVGFWSVPLFVFGLVAPFSLEKKHVNNVLALFFLGFGFSLHAFMDGVGLQLHEALSIPEGNANHLQNHEHEQTTLVTAILAHRIPVGLFLGFSAIQKPRLSYSFGILICLTTIAGFSVGREIPYIGGVQAFIGGALLHVIVGHQVLLPYNKVAILQVIGALSSGVLLFVMSDGHMDSLFLEIWFFVSLIVLSYLTLKMTKNKGVSVNQHESSIR